MSSMKRGHFSMKPSHNFLKNSIWPATHCVLSVLHADINLYPEKWPRSQSNGFKLSDFLSDL